MVVNPTLQMITLRSRELNDELKIYKTVKTMLALLLPVIVFFKTTTS